MATLIDYFRNSLLILPIILITTGTILWLIHYFINIRYKSYFSKYKIQQCAFQISTLKNDILYSIVTLTTAVFSIVGLYYLSLAGFIQIHIFPQNPLSFGLELIVYFFYFDSAYYFMHRAIHTEPLYSIAHIHHHRTTSPNVATTLAFHPIEVLFILGIFLFALIVLKIHLVPLVCVMLFFATYNFAVHCGHDFFPRTWYQQPYTKWLISPIFHDLHHAKFNYNFGALTVLWDNLLNTISPNLVKEFVELHEKEQSNNKIEARDFSLR